jgi:hypothetical protein
VLAFDLLRWDEARFARFHANHAISYPECRGRLDAGSGIGVACVQAFAPKDALSEYQIRLALGTLKDSGRMASIITDAHAKASVELCAEQEAAERALIEAKAQPSAPAPIAAQVPVRRAWRGMSVGWWHRRPGTV